MSGLAAPPPDAPVADCGCASPEMHRSAARVADRLRRGPGRGQAFVLAVDGPSGAGKTTLAACVAAQVGAGLFHMDDIYPGWTGLERGAQSLVDWVLRPLSEHRPAVWHRYDWYAGRYAEARTIRVGQPLVVEGVGAYSRQSAPFLHLTVWVEAAASERRTRVESRDGDSTAETWDLWAAQERAFHTRHHTREAADVLIRN